MTLLDKHGVFAKPTQSRFIRQVPFHQWMGVRIGSKVFVRKKSLQLFSELVKLFLKMNMIVLSLGVHRNVGRLKNRIVRGVGMGVVLFKNNNGRSGLGVVFSWGFFNGKVLFEIIHFPMMALFDPLFIDMK